MVLIAASFSFQITSALFAYKIRCAISSYTALQIANCLYISKMLVQLYWQKSRIWTISLLIVWFQIGNWKIMFVIAHWTTSCAPLWVKLPCYNSNCTCLLNHMFLIGHPDNDSLRFFTFFVREEKIFIDPGRSGLSYVKMNSVCSAVEAALTKPVFSQLP